MISDSVYAEAINELEGYDFDSHFQMNKMTMNKVEQITSEKLRVPTLEERLLRGKLILEEALETIVALGLNIEFTQDKTWHLTNAGEEKYNPKEVLDGVCDLLVVANGTLLSCGLYTVLEEALKRVDQNNWSKVKDGVIRNADGKYQKPPGYKPVVLDDLIEKVS